MELQGDILVHPTHVKDVSGAVSAVLEKPMPHKTVLNIGGERTIRLNDYYALIANKLGVARKRWVLPKILAGYLAAAASPVLNVCGKRNPLLIKTAKGMTLSYGNDMSRFRDLYAFPLVSLEKGIEEEIEWAEKSGFLE